MANCCQTVRRISVVFVHNLVSANENMVNFERQITTQPKDVQYHDKLRTGKNLCIAALSANLQRCADHPQDRPPCHTEPQAGCSDRIGNRQRHLENPDILLRKIETPAAAHGQADQPCPGGKPEHEQKDRGDPLIYEKRALGIAASDAHWCHNSVSKRMCRRTSGNFVAWCDTGDPVV